MNKFVRLTIFGLFTLIALVGTTQSSRANYPDFAICGFMAPGYDYGLPPDTRAVATFGDNTTMCPGGSGTYSQLPLADNPASPNWNAIRYLEKANYEVQDGSAPVELAPSYQYTHPLWPNLLDRDHCVVFSGWQDYTNAERAWLNTSTVNVPYVGNRTRTSSTSGGAFGCLEAPMSVNYYAEGYVCRCETRDFNSNDVSFYEHWTTCQPLADPPTLNLTTPPNCATSHVFDIRVADPQGTTTIDKLELWFGNYNPYVIDLVHLYDSNINYRYSNATLTIPGSNAPPVNAVIETCGTVNNPITGDVNVPVTACYTTGHEMRIRLRVTNLNNLPSNTQIRGRAFDENYWGQPVNNSGITTYGTYINNCVTPTPTSTPLPANTPPQVTANAVFNNNQCGGPNNISAIHVLQNANAGLNNPMRITSSHSDPDGINDIDTIGIWISKQTNGHPDFSANEISQSAFLMLRRLGPNNYVKIATNNPTLPQVPWNDPRFIASVVNPLGRQEYFNDVQSMFNSSAIGYTQPISIVETPGPNSVILVGWDAGFINSGAFDGTVRLYAVTVDKSGATPTAGSPSWVLNNQPWTVDLQAPAASINLQFVTGNQLNATYSGSDNNGLANPSSFSKVCQANNLQSGETIVLSRGAISFTFQPGNLTSNPCLSETNTGTINYNYANSSANGTLNFNFQVKDLACNPSNTATATAQSTSSWLMTTRGDVYAKSFSSNVPSNAISGTGLSPELVEQGQSPFFSTYTYSTLSGVVSRASQKNYVKTGYTDQNSAPRGVGYTNWFDLILNQAREEADNFYDKNNLGLESYGWPEYTTESIIEKYVLGTVNNPVQIDTNATNVVYLHSLRIGSSNIPQPLPTVTCNTRTIFITKYEIILDPDIVTPDPTKGCVFISQTTLTVTGGRNKNSNGTQTNYDIIHGFLMGNSVVIETDALNSDGLLIKGGVVSHVKTPNLTSLILEFNRSLDPVRSQAAPSEIVRFDPRYMFIFEDILNYDLIYNIREKQFVEALER